VRIARISRDGEPAFGIVEGEPGAEIVALVVGDPLVTPLRATGEHVPLADVRLLTPVIPRSKVVGMGRNYADHAAEFGNEVPEHPQFFLKPNTSVISPGDPIRYPPQSTDVQFEGELAVVIGRACWDLPAERAHEVIFGYTIANDVTARDLQRSDNQWTRAKGFDSFCPLGPWIVVDLDPSDLALTTELNGELKQSARTSEMVHKIPDLISHVSSVMTLLPGDVILTGTPAGVGPMKPGDEVTVSIEGIGSLTNPVVAR
jgi:2-keto-4-pentenoate hydratase/2-oxohepta-3-ene-1,7-dioic acid hydratase in catechol pathway